jgi:PAS domain-containing protein
MTEAYPGIERTHMFAVLRQAMESREVAEMENEFVGPDGTSKCFQLLIQPVPEGLFILSLDITSRKRAEEALRKNQARWEAVLENLHEGLILSDLEGKLLHWNRAALEMLDLSLEESRGAIDDFASLFELFTPDGVAVPFEQRPLVRVLRGEAFHDQQLRVRRIGQPWKRLFSYSGSIARRTLRRPWRCMRRDPPASCSSSRT